jgi:hypothetical protein
MTRRPLIDSAPGKALIDAVIGGDSQAFRELYRLRREWSGGYPLIHDYLCTYGMLSDLALPAEVGLALVPVAMEMALTEPPETFHCALFALAEVIPDDRISPRPAGFGAGLLRLRELALRQRDLPNLVCTWETLVTRARCLKPVAFDASYELPLRELLISRKA